MQYHASLITADGAYHCPVGSIMAIFNFKTLEWDGKLHIPQCSPPLFGVALGLQCWWWGPSCGCYTGPPPTTSKKCYSTEVLISFLHCAQVPRDVVKARLVQHQLLLLHLLWKPDAARVHNSSGSRQRVRHKLSWDQLCTWSSTIVRSL